MSKQILIGVKDAVFTGQPTLTLTKCEGADVEETPVYCETQTEGARMAKAAGIVSVNYRVTVRGVRAADNVAGYGKANAQGKAFSIGSGTLSLVEHVAAPISGDDQPLHQGLAHFADGATQPKLTHTFSFMALESLESELGNSPESPNKYTAIFVSDGGRSVKSTVAG
jgi:hypothetical protein